MSAAPNKPEGLDMNDEQLLDLAGKHLHYDRRVDIISFARALLSASKPAVQGEPIAYLSTDPKQWGGSRIKPQGTFTIPVYLHPAAPAQPGEWDTYRLKVAEDCNERLMSACSDTGCPDGVNMAEWIRGLGMLAPSRVAPAPSGETAVKRLPSREEIQNLRDHGHGEEAAYWEEALRSHPAIIPARGSWRAVQYDRRRAASPQATATQAPFANCQFKRCDLPGQCQSEGKCHHPRAESPQPQAQTERALTEPVEREIVRALQKALFYWMPRIAGEDSPAGQKAAEHAYLLIGLDDNLTECWGDQILHYVGTMNRQQEKLELVLRDAGCEDEADHLEFIEKLAARAKLTTEQGPEFSDGPDSDGFSGPRPWNGFNETARIEQEHSDALAGDINPRGKQ